MTATHRILRVIHSLRRETGGPVAGLAEATPVLSEAGIASEFAVLDGFSPDELPFSQRPVHVFSTGGSYGSCADFSEWLDKHIRNFDAVFVHGCWKFHGVAVRSAALRHGVPYFLYPHGMLDPWFNKRYPLKWIKKQAYWWLREYWVLRDARAVLFTSSEEMRLAALAFKPYRANGQVVPYGTCAPKPEYSDDGMCFRETIGLSGKAPYLLYLGRIHEKKGIDLLVDAWKEWKSTLSEQGRSWQLVVAGPEGNPQYESIIKAKMKTCPDVHRVDGAFDREKWSALSGALALVLPSHQENFGMVVAEALSVGTPVLLTRQVNVWREVVDAGAGFAADDTPDGIRNLLGQLRSDYENNREALNDRAHKCFEVNFDLRTSAHALAELLKTS